MQFPLDTTLFRNINRLRHRIAPLLLLSLSFANAQMQVPPIDFKITGGYATHSPFSYFEADNKEFKIDVFQVGIGFDVWITRAISIGYMGSFPIATEGEYRDLFEDVFIPIPVEASYHQVRAMYSSNQEKKISFAGGLGFHYMQHYYSEFNFGRKATGVSFQ